MTYPELTLVPILFESLHGERLVSLGSYFQLLELFRVLILVGVEGGQRREGVGREGAGDVVSDMVL